MVHHPDDASASFADPPTSKGIPADEVFEAQLSWDPDRRWKSIPPILDDLKRKARQLGLWNMWLHSHYEGGAGFTNVEYALMCETMGRSHIASETMNCSAPDTGNMEVNPEAYWRDFCSCVQINLLTLEREKKVTCEIRERRTEETMAPAVIGRADSISVRHDGEIRCVI